MTFFLLNNIPCVVDYLRYNECVVGLYVGCPNVKLWAGPVKSLADSAWLLRTHLMIWGCELIWSSPSLLSRAALCWLSRIPALTLVMMLCLESLDPWDPYPRR